MFIQEVFAKKQTMRIFTVQELRDFSERGQLILRESNAFHIRKLRQYVVENILTGQIFLPPIVATLIEGNLEEDRLDQLLIIDGVQRLKALTNMDSVITKLIDSDEPLDAKKGFKLKYQLAKVQVAMQIFEGLSIDEANQLYIDLNTKGKKVALSKRIAYDSRNEINITTNKVLQTNTQLRKAGVEEEKAMLVRPRNKKFLSLSQLRTLIALFISDKYISGQLSIEHQMQQNVEENLSLFNVWLEELFLLYPAEKIGDYDHSMLASFILLQALAQYAVADTKELPIAERRQKIQTRMRALGHVDWSREQVIWERFDGSRRGRKQYYYLANNKSTIRELESWLHREGGEVDVKR